SNAGFLVVGDAPEGVEQEPNDQREQAQPLGQLGTINGRLATQGDRDCYRFTARAGEQVTFEVEAARLQARAHDGQVACDPVLSLPDATGRELAASDDEARADPVLRYRFEKAGDYVLDVHDVRLDGNPAWIYRLNVIRGPKLTGCFPP